MIRPFLLSLLAINSVFANECWKCHGPRQCGSSEFWVESTCYGGEQECYTFRGNDGRITKKGCTFSGCRSAPGWNEATDCDSCEGNLCNGNPFDDQLSGGGSSDDGMSGGGSSHGGMSGGGSSSVNLRSCWTCVGRQCADSAQWFQEACPEEERHCYSFLADDGTVTKRGCAPSSSCLSAPGWRFGVDCETCDTDVCNGEQLSGGGSSSGGMSGGGSSSDGMSGGGSSSLRCWSCSDLQCESESQWDEQICGAEDLYCYTLERESGIVYKKGCAEFESCLSTDGWEFGVDCDMCDTQLCNGNEIMVEGGSSFSMSGGGSSDGGMSGGGSSSDMKCWSCEDSNCESRSLWEEKTCDSEEQYCFSFSRDGGPAYKKGCARHDSCISADGWEFGIDCDTCDSKLCNGEDSSSGMSGGGSSDDDMSGGGSSSGLQCWRCADDDCLFPARWRKSACSSSARNCFRLARDDGTVYKRGCTRHDTCLSIPGWDLGVDCDLCTEDECNGLTENELTGGGSSHGNQEIDLSGGSSWSENDDDDQLSGGSNREVHQGGLRTGSLFPSGGGSNTDVQGGTVDDEDKLHCWSCEQEECVNNEDWEKVACDSDATNCYKFARADGSGVYKRGCAAHDSCLSIPGWVLGIKCTLCTDNECNGAEPSDTVPKTDDKITEHEGHDGMSGGSSSGESGGSSGGQSRGNRHKGSKTIAPCFVFTVLAAVTLKIIV